MTSSSESECLADVEFLLPIRDRAAILAQDLHLELHKRGPNSNNIPTPFIRLIIAKSLFKKNKSNGHTRVAHWQVELDQVRSLFDLCTWC